MLLITRLFGKTGSNQRTLETFFMICQNGDFHDVVGFGFDHIDVLIEGRSLGLRGTIIKRDISVEYKAMLQKNNVPFLKIHNNEKPLRNIRARVWSQYFRN